MNGDAPSMDDDAELTGVLDRAQVRQRVLLGAILWPSFLGASALEALTFLMVDPLDVHWLGHDLGLGRTAIYSLVFLMYWSACALSAAGALLVMKRVAA
jgi:hypothetical protein